MLASSTRITDACARLPKRLLRVARPPKLAKGGGKGAHNSDRNRGASMANTMSDNTACKDKDDISVTISLIKPELDWNHL